MFLIKQYEEPQRPLRERALPPISKTVEPWGVPVLYVTHDQQTVVERTLTAVIV